jgi:hypothetical protein
MDWTTELLAAGLPVISAVTNSDGVVDASFTRTLTAAEWHLYLTITDPAKARKQSAKTNARLVVEIKDLSPAQAETWFDRAVTSGITESSITASIDAATTSAQLKPILKTLTRVLYASMKTNKTILSLLVALRDEIMPDI